MPKSKHQIPGRVRSAYEFIKAHRDQYSVQMMCRVLEVAQSCSSHSCRSLATWCTCRRISTSASDSMRRRWLRLSR
jgi:hypothetical protein